MVVRLATNVGRAEIAVVPIVADGQIGISVPKQEEVVFGILLIAAISAAISAAHPEDVALRLTRDVLVIDAPVIDVLPAN